MTEAEKVTEDGRVVYELKGTAGQKVYEIRVDAEGKVLSVAEDDEPQPQAGKKNAPAGAAPGGDF